MQQLLLDIRPPRQPELARFVVGRNAELMAQLTAMRDGRAVERAVYLWGERGSGKSYLLAAWANACRAAGLTVGESEGMDAVVFDGAESWSAERQREVFTVYNRVRERGGLFVAAGGVPPAQLEGLPDLRTRLGWGLVFQLLPLDDAEKRAALIECAAGLGFVLDPAVADYLLTQTRREMQRLLATVDALDRLSLATRRPITLPLLKALLARG